MTDLEDSVFQVQDVDVVVSSSDHETIILKDEEDRKSVSHVQRPFEPADGGVTHSGVDDHCVDLWDL